MASTAVYFHERFLEHETGRHPESAERLVVARQVLDESGLDFSWRRPSAASVEAVARVHGRDYIEHVRQISASGGGALDWDTVLSPASYEAALLGVGAGLEAVERARAEGERSLLLCRPPGHHALRDRGMGFCLFNNIAAAAVHALEELGLERVLIFDWDVHHGNGTQEAFYPDPRVLFVSMHQEHHYPGTGAVNEVGAGDGRGYTVNIPLPAGSGDGAVFLVFERVLEPLARSFAPQLVLVSAGYDSQARDPLGGLAFSEAAFQWMALRLSRLAEEREVAGPVCFLEGGYNPQMLAGSVVRTLRGLAGEEVVFAPEVHPPEEKAVGRALEELAAYWPEVPAAG